MTLDEFKLELIRLKFKMTSDEETVFSRHTRYRKRNKEVCIQTFEPSSYGYGEDYNIYYEVETKLGTIDLRQHSTTDLRKALNNILELDKKLK
jgi:hypothetical protein